MRCQPARPEPMTAIDGPACEWDRAVGFATAPPNGLPTRTARDEPLQRPIEIGVSSDPRRQAVSVLYILVHRSTEMRRSWRCGRRQETGSQSPSRMCRIGVHRARRPTRFVPQPLRIRYPDRHLDHPAACRWTQTYKDRDQCRAENATHRATRMPLARWTLVASCAT